jgi:hypothetical protein
LMRSFGLAGLTVCICLGSRGFATGQQVAIDVNPALPCDIALPSDIAGAKATLQHDATSGGCSYTIARRKHSMAPKCIATVCAASMPSISSVGLNARKAATAANIC